MQRANAFLFVLLAGTISFHGGSAACGFFPALIWQDTGESSPAPDAKQETGEQEEKTESLYPRIAEMVGAGDVRDAAAEIDRFVEANPGVEHSEEIHKSRILVKLAFERINSGRDAWDQLKKLLDFELANLSDPLSLEHVPATIAAMVPLSNQTARNPETFALIEDAEKRFQALAQGNPAGVAQRLLSQIRIIKGSALLQMNEYDRAMATFRDEITQLRALRDADPGNEGLQELYFQALAQLGIHSRDPEERAPALMEYQTFVQSKLEAEPANPDALRMLIAVISARIETHLVRPETLGEPLTVRDPEKVDELFAEARSVLENFPDEEPQLAQLVRALQTGLGQLEIVFKGSARIPELIGQPAAELPVKAWINGDDPGAEGRKGKVILLDFWSPGVQSTPEAIKFGKSLIERFGDSGFMILGVTQYYNLRWNAEAGALFPGNSRVPEDEQQEALEKFLQQQGATWPTMIVEAGLAVQENYGASSLPHFVLVDRKGNIRMIRVALTDTIKSQLETTIAELLAEE